MYGSLVIPGPKSQRNRNAASNAVEEAWFNGGATVSVGTQRIRRDGDFIVLNGENYDREEAVDNLVTLLAE